MSLRLIAYALVLAITEHRITVKGQHEQASNRPSRIECRRLSLHIKNRSLLTEPIWISCLMSLRGNGRYKCHEQWQHA
jgi:hypothetical protein